ncbi:MAG TPA: hypothetical protein VD969_27840 [Symbiobacteriaceae bacterium]|nr:hypothetical protein [Symbiobacteriaceae bacterium]
MDVLPDKVLLDFTAFYDHLEQFISTVTPTTDLKPIEEHIHPTYQATIGFPGMDGVQPCNRAAAIAGLRQGVEGGYQIRTESRTIRLRSPTEAAAFLERVAVKDGQEVARSFHLEIWRLIDGDWQLVRETKELLAR